MSDETHTIDLVCVGPCDGSKGKKSMQFLRIDDSNPLAVRVTGDELVFSARRLKCWVGGVFRFKVSQADPLIVLVPPEYVEAWHDQDARMEWQAEGRTWDAARAVRAMENAEGRRDMIAERLEPLRRLYRRLPAMQQRAMEVLILMALRKK